MNIKLSMFMLVAISLFMVTQGSNVYAEKCEDIAGVEKWDGEAHDDNNPSEKEFNKLVFGGKDGNIEQQGTTCEIAEGIDKEELEGSIEEHQWDEFVETIAYDGTSEEVQECFEKRFDLPKDNGDKHLADYEFQKCATSDY